MAVATFRKMWLFQMIGVAPLRLGIECDFVPGSEDRIAMLSIGTDGIDGPTDAAGAWVDQSTIARARSRSLDADAYLADNNAYAFFHALGDLIHTGPTGTNVGDLQVILLA